MRLILAAMVIGVAWEVFEIFAGIPREANFAFDTSLDLTMDFIGALAGFALARYLVRDGTINAQ